MTHAGDLTLHEPLKAIIFDFGAVLFTWQPHLLVAQHFPAQVVHDDAEQTHARALARSIFSHADWHEFDRGTVTVPEIVQRSSARLRLPLPAMAHLVAVIPDHLLPIQGTLNVLQNLLQIRKQRRERGGDLRLFYLSNMPSPYARVLQERHPFLAEFDGGIFSGDVRLIKPEPAIFALAEQRFAVDPKATLFIDDLQANIDAAQARGWQTHLFESPPTLEITLKKALGN